MRSAPKYFSIALALAALATSGAAPVLAQSAYGVDAIPRTGTSRSAFAGGISNSPADDNPKGQHGSDCPPDH
jgi:hypothetical protein